MIIYVRLIDLENKKETVSLSRVVTLIPILQSC